MADAPGAAHCCSTNAFNTALCCWRRTTLSAAIVSNFSGSVHCLMDMIISVTPPPFKVPPAQTLTLLMLGIGLFTSDVRSARYALP